MLWNKIILYNQTLLLEGSSKIQLQEMHSLKYLDVILSKDGSYTGHQHQDRDSDDNDYREEGSIAAKSSRLLPCRIRRLVVPVLLYRCRFGENNPYIREQVDFKDLQINRNLKKIWICYRPSTKQGVVL